MLAPRMIPEILHSLVDELQKELFEKPFFLATEHDFAGYLYYRLFSRKEFREPFFDSCGKPNFRIHLEYPRYRRNEGGEIERRNMRYDVAVLRATGPTDDNFFRDYSLLQRRVWLGFEIKVHRNSHITRILQDYDNDYPAFLAKDLENCKIQKLPSDFGVIFHINVAKTKPTSNGDLQKIKVKWDEISKLVSIPLFFVYLESYNEKRVEPQKIWHFPH